MTMTGFEILFESSSSTGLVLCEEEELACVFSDRGLKTKHAEVPIDTF